MTGGWLARLKTEIASDTPATEPTKPQRAGKSPGFVGFVAHPWGDSKNAGPAESVVLKLGPQAVNKGASREIAPATDPRHRYWPNATAMSSWEFDTYMARMARFTERGVRHDDAEGVAKTLSIRDREQDDRRVCLECVHLRGAGHWRCANWVVAGVAIRAMDAQLSS